MFESAVQDPLPHIHAQNVMKKKGSTPHIGTNDTSKGIDAHNFRSRPSVKEEFFLIYQRSVPNDLMKMRRKFGQLLKDICIAGWVGGLIICCLVNKHHYTLDSSRSNVIFFGEKKRAKVSQLHRR